MFNENWFNENIGCQLNSSYTRILIITISLFFLHILALSSIIPSGNLIPLFILGGNIILHILNNINKYINNDINININNNNN
jgi:hypothetical protein